MAKRNYNPKRQYEIHNTSLNPVASLDIDGHKVELNPKTNMAVVTDTGLGEEIAARYGQKSKTDSANSVMVVPVDDLSPAREHGHRYTHTVPDMSRIKYKTKAEREAAQRGR